MIILKLDNMSYRVPVFAWVLHREWNFWLRGGLDLTVSNPWLWFSWASTSLLFRSDASSLIWPGLFSRNLRLNLSCGVMPQSISDFALTLLFNFLWFVRFMKVSFHSPGLLFFTAAIDSFQDNHIRRSRWCKILGPFLLDRSFILS